MVISMPCTRVFEMVSSWVRKKKCHWKLSIADSFGTSPMEDFLVGVIFRDTVIPLVGEVLFVFLSPDGVILSNVAWLDAFLSLMKGWKLRHVPGFG